MASGRHQTVPHSRFYAPSERTYEGQHQSPPEFRSDNTLQDRTGNLPSERTYEDDYQISVRSEFRLNDALNDWTGNNTRMLFDEYKDQDIPYIRTSYKDPTISNSPKDYPTFHNQSSHSGLGDPSAPGGKHQNSNTRNPEPASSPGVRGRITCDHSSCLDPNGKPWRTFSRKADLSRHYKSMHEQTIIDCPNRRCERRGQNGFSRKDHLVEHRRGYHGEKIEKRGRPS